MLSLAPSLAVAVDYPNGASLFGSIAVVTVLAWPLVSRRRLALLIQCVGTSAFGLHFLLLGSQTAAATSAIALIQVAAAVIIRRRPHLWLIYGATSIILAGAAAATWHGLPSLFASIGSLLAMVARLQQSTTCMKAVFLIAAPFWATHNFMVGSLFGLAVDAVSTTSIVVALCQTGLHVIRTNELELCRSKLKRS